jgi:LDH2 family malate/lactate/ureidoglycolate dehydrogenase
MLISESVLRAFTQNIFLSMGCSNEHADLAADVLLLSDLRGIDSHGVARLIGYVRLWENKRINTKPDITIVHETPTTYKRQSNMVLDGYRFVTPIILVSRVIIH